MFKKLSYNCDKKNPKKKELEAKFGEASVSRSLTTALSSFLAVKEIYQTGK